MFGFRYRITGDNGQNAHRFYTDYVPHVDLGWRWRPERVARAVVKCLRRPRPEVWTSFTVRAVAAAMILAPRFGDWMIRRQSAKDHAARAGS